MFTQKAYTPVGGEGNPTGAEEKQATDTTSTIYVNGQVVSLKGYNINNNNYFKLRDLGAALGIGIDWDSTTKTVVVDSTGTRATGNTSTSNAATTSTRVINNSIGKNGYPDGPKMILDERIALGKATTLPPTDVNHPGWGPKGEFWLCTLKPGEEIPPAAGYGYAGIEHTGEAGGASWSGVSAGG